MDVTKVIWENIIIFSVVLLAFVLVHIFIKPVYWSLKNRLHYSNAGKSLFRTNIPHVITNLILPILLIALLTALQQQYGFIQLGNKDNYIALVISIVTLYGILYTFLQFTIGYALQNKNDKYWGRSITKDFFLKRLGFEIFKSSMFKLLLLYAVTYPILSKVILIGINDLKISKDFPLAFWEVSVVTIYILYAYLFLHSLNSMKTLYDLQERRSLGLEYKIKEAVADEYKRSFEYSYEGNSDFFIDKLFVELESLNQKEQADMLMYVIREVFSQVEFPLSRRSVLHKLFNQGEREFNYRPFYVNNLFISLYEKIEKHNIQLNLHELLVIYRWHDNAVNISIGSLNDELKESFIDKLTKVYSNKKNWDSSGECTYFKLPSVIEKRISSYVDIEKINHHITQRLGFKAIQESGNVDFSEFKNSSKMLIKSYDMYLCNLLDNYKKYLDDLKHRQHSVFLGSHRSYDRTDFIDGRINDAIYEYIIYMEYTEQNKEYAFYLANHLDYKYKVSLIFYHMLYTGTPWEWKKDVLFFKRIVNAFWVNESVTDEHVLEFVCHKIEDSNIGHKIGSALITWICQQINITRLNEEIVDRCLLERYISYAKLLKIIYIFTDNRRYPMDFYEFDFDKVTTSTHWDWQVAFLKEMLKTPKLLTEEFFVQHLLYYCKKISYTIDHFILENDFRVFFINRFFKFSESQFIELHESHYLGKGIIEFLILCLCEIEYEYLIGGKVSKSFSSEVITIINRENKPVEIYVQDLVRQANECRNVVSIVKENEIMKRLRRILEPQF
ncbi:hypothetical protein DVH26_04615 [Paenibacillus sp. H1-7]|uniref:hypothetical protein n=1 Tax=Paenibacillus sp. H1-7 TaxID=2282849 RepID=UPI001EF7CC6C|nr:hypothetical protein [Paenibacillus sp. H1-7]ULL13789.1 hypothetical protein DVH26_04615 [Paenibacillus sp. H1-7]